MVHRLGYHWTVQLGRNSIDTKWSKCIVGTVLSALDFENWLEPSKSQCANPQWCLQCLEFSQPNLDFTPYYHIYNCNIFFQFIFLGQPHVQISIVSGSPTDSPLIRFLPIFLTDCPISFQHMFETTQTYFLAGLIKSKPDFYFGSDFSKIQGKHYLCSCTVNVCLLT